MTNVYPRNVYQIRENPFDKRHPFGIKYTGQQKLYKNLAIFDFESIYVQEETFKDTKKTTTCTAKHLPISASISSNLVEEPISLYNPDPHHLVSSFIGTLERLASQIKAQIKLFFHDIETTIKNKLRSVLEKITQHQNRREQVRESDMNQNDCDNENCASTHFLQI